MRKIITILIFLFPLWVFGQKNNALEQLKISPNFTYRTWINKGTITEIGRDEKGETAWHFTINYNRRLISKLWLHVGLQS